MTNYFEGCRTPLERKTRYRELAKRHHPDIGGSLLAMQEVNRQYRDNLFQAYSKVNSSTSAFETKMDRWKERFDSRLDKYADAYYQFVAGRENKKEQSLNEFMGDLMSGKFRDMDSTVLQLNPRFFGGRRGGKQKKLS